MENLLLLSRYGRLTAGNVQRKTTKKLREPVRHAKPHWENRYTVRLTKKQVDQLKALGRFEKRKLAGLVREALDVAFRQI